ncbi:MAG: DoxX family protein [Verrucomicrobiota bacterium]
MIPFYLLLIAQMAFLVTGLAGVRYLQGYDRSTSAALALMFLFTGVTHFTPMKAEYLAMIPEPFPRDIWMIYLSGAFEISGAIGLLVPSLRRWAAIGLFLLVLALTPANIHAAINDIPFNNRPATALWLRIPVQIVFLSMLAFVAWSARRSLVVIRRSE